MLLEPHNLHAAQMQQHTCLLHVWTADVPADLARRWETTFIASKSKRGATQGGSPRDTQRPCNQTTMLHEAKLEEKPADWNTPGFITSMPQFRPTQTPSPTLAITMHTCTQEPVYLFLSTHTPPLPLPDTFKTLRGECHHGMETSKHWASSACVMRHPVVWKSLERSSAAREHRSMVTRLRRNA